MKATVVGLVTPHLLRIMLLLGVSILMSGCGPKPIMTRPTAKPPNTYVVFFDGTANRYESETNVSKLRHRMAWRPDDTIGTYYIEGVGAGNKLVGMATGYGLGFRIRDAYRYLLRNYRAGDRIFLFGFSRGAYSARILASIVQYGGLPNEPVGSGDLADQVAAVVYDAYKGRKDHYTRESEIDKALVSLGFDAASFEPRKIEVMGLWDTVAALGRPDGTEDDFKVPSPLYADQLCNVERALHAVSLDDNRALEFTPILLTRDHLVRNCLRFEGEDRDPTPEEAARMLDDIVEEVWFTGAHSDVGGGYPVGRLDGLSMNWMLNELASQKLVGVLTPIRAHHLDCAHDAERFLGGYVYEERGRSLANYAEGSPYNDGKLKLHESVLTRLHGPLPVHAESREDSWGTRSPVGLPAIFPACFPGADGGDYRIELENEGCQLSVAGKGTVSPPVTVNPDESHLTCAELVQPLY